MRSAGAGFLGQLQEAGGHVGPAERITGDQQHCVVPGDGAKDRGHHGVVDGQGEEVCRAGAQGVGRIDVVEDRLVGIKSREIYEAPGAMALITAHKHLEDITVEREQARFKATVGQRWAELVYDGQWFSPLKRSLDAFIEDTQKYVSGDIRMVLHGGQAIVNGRRSETSLYDFDLATYDTGDTFDQSMARGFIELWGMSAKVASGRDIRVAGQ